MTGHPARETCGHGEFPSPPVFVSVTSGLVFVNSVLCLSQKTESLNIIYIDLGVFRQCFESLLASSSPLKTSHRFPHLSLCASSASAVSLRRSRIKGRRKSIMDQDCVGPFPIRTWALSYINVKRLGRARLSYFKPAEYRARRK